MWLVVGRDLELERVVRCNDGSGTLVQPLKRLWGEGQTRWRLGIVAGRLAGSGGTVFSW